MPSDTGPQQAGIGRERVLDMVRGSLAEILEVDPGTIADGASFADLGADSLALIELVEALEKDLGTDFAGFRIDDEDLEDLKTVRDAVDYVCAKLGNAS
jgi:acyl carrier protein